MKIFYLTGSVIFTVLILILAFANISAQCNNLHFLFIPIAMNPTTIILIVAAIGIITGIMYHALLSKIMETPESDEDDDSF